MGKAILKVSPEFLGNFMYNGEVHVRIESGLPDDATCVNIHWNHEKRFFELCYESEEFPALKPGQKVQIIPGPIVTDMENKKEGKENVSLEQKET